MCLSDINDVEYSIADPSQDDFIIYHVKLTDSALKILENSARNLDASFKLSLDEDHGSFEVIQSNRVARYTLSSQPAGNNDGFQDCVSYKKSSVKSLGKYASRLIVNAKDDSFDMARERMAQVENEQRNSCSKQLSGVKSRHSTSKSNAPLKPRICSYANPQPSSKSLKKSSSDVSDFSTSNDCISSKNIREIVISLLALRPHSLTELHSKLKCRNDPLIKSDMNKLLKQVSSCCSDGTFQLLPKFYEEVNPSWSGYTAVDRIKVEHLKKKHTCSSPNSNPCHASSSRPKTTDMPLSLQQKIAILDELKLGKLTHAQILRKHSISIAMLEQWQANEEDLRYSYASLKNSNSRSPELSPANPGFSSSMRVSTAPRLPSAASRSNRSNVSSTHHFLGEMGLPPSLRSSGSNSAPVSADGSQTTVNRPQAIPLSKEYPVVASTMSQKSSSGCSSMGSSILSSPQHQGLGAYVSSNQSRPTKTISLAREKEFADHVTTNMPQVDPFAPLSVEPVASVESPPGKRPVEEGDPYYKKVPRIDHSDEASNADRFEIATRIVQSMLKEERTSEEPSAELQREPKNKNLALHSDPSISDVFQPETDSHFQNELANRCAGINKMYPEVTSSSEAHSYKREFDAEYPEYLALRERVHQRWSHLKDLHRQLLTALEGREKSRHGLALELRTAAKEACSAEAEEDRLRLGFLDHKLRTLKGKICEFIASKAIGNDPTLDQHSRNRKRPLEHSHSPNQRKHSGRQPKRESRESP